MNIKKVSSTKLRGNLAAILDAIGNEIPFCVVTRNGKQEHAIINLDKLEDLLASSDPKYLKDIQKSRQQAAAGELFSLEDVFDNV